MTTPTYNLLAVRKELGAIEHRINDAALNPNIKATCIRRSLDNLIETTPRKFHGIHQRCRDALDAGDTLELIAGLALIQSMLPPMTYGCVLQGQVFEVTNRGIYRKNKAGRVEIMTGTILPHFPADLPVKLVNE